MGSCFSQCFGGRNARNYTRRVHYDRANSTEFESLMDENPRDEPLSFPIITEYEKYLLAEHNYSAFVVEQNEADVEVDQQVTQEEELLELEEEAFFDAKCEAMRIAKLVNHPQQIINPANLLLETTSDSWLGNDGEWSVAEIHSEDQTIDSSRLSALVNPAYVSGPHCRTASTSSNGNGSHMSHDRGLTCTSTPPSSLDLEWEHEAGFYSVCQLRGKTDDDTTVTLESDKCASPLSNELEWDDGFVSPELADLDLETEQLISEIELLTSQALDDSAHNSVHFHR